MPKARVKNVKKAVFKDKPKGLFTAWRVFKYLVFFWSVDIQSEYSKIRTRKNSKSGHFSRIVFLITLFYTSTLSRLFYPFLPISLYSNTRHFQKLTLKKWWKTRYHFAKSGRVFCRLFYCVFFIDCSILSESTKVIGYLQLTKSKMMCRKEILQVCTYKRDAKFNNLFIYYLFIK